MNKISNWKTNAYIRQRASVMRWMKDSFIKPYFDECTKLMRIGLY